MEKKGNNLKALYRRGLARFRMGMLEEAKADLMQARKLDGESKAVKTELANLIKALVESKKKEKAASGDLLKKVKSYGK